MPKRVIHGEGIWRSDKLARVEPAWVRAEYANLIPLSLANGVFESNPRRVWSEVYSYNRPDITVRDVETIILSALVRVGLLFCWKDEDGKVWGYWPGIEKPGRLPGKSRRGRNEAIGPEPPAEELRKFLESNGIHKLPGFGSGSGFGFGTGSSLGSGKGDAQAQAPSQDSFGLFWKAYPKKKAKSKAEEAWKKIKPLDIAKIMASIEAHKMTDEWKRNKGQFIPYPATFLNQRRWEDELPEVSGGQRTSKPNGGGKFAAYSRKSTDL